MSTPVKSTSLNELGYTIKPDKGKDEKGNEFVYKVTGPAPVFHIKRTKKGRLVAVKDKDSNIESTIAGLYDFKEENGDLRGRRATSQTGKVQPITTAA